MVKTDLNKKYSGSMIQRYQNYYSEIRSIGRDKFFTGFDGGKDANDYFRRSEINFRANFEPHMGPNRGVAYDIGFGGGGMLLAASKRFTQVAGVDIHKEQDFVRGELSMQGAHNVKLFEGKGSQIVWPNSTIDFLFSWVTFIHLDYEQTMGYLNDIPRVLAPDGIAVIYYHACKEDFIELKRKRVNISCLSLSHKFVRKTCEKLGLTVVRIIRSIRPNHGVGGQHAVVLRKDE